MIDVLRAIQKDIHRVVTDCRKSGVDASAIQGVITERAVDEISNSHHMAKCGPKSPAFWFCGSIKGVRFTVVPDERIGWLLRVPAAAD